MAASTSRQPHEIALPPSPQNVVKNGKKQSRKGKGKENVAAQAPQVTGEVSWDVLESESDWEWSHLTDPSASKARPIFTKDGNYFFSLVGPSVKIHSVATGQVVSTLTAPRSTNSGTSSVSLTTAILNPHNSLQLITGSLDGRLVVWDFLEAVLLQTVDISQPIHYICAHDNWKDTVFVAASKPSKKTKANGTEIDDNAVVLRVSLKPVGGTSQSTEILPIGKTRFPTGLTLSPNGAWLIAIAGHKVYVAATSLLAAGFTKYVSPERLTCLSFHPNEDYFATGDDKGNVRLWYCLNEPAPSDVRGVEKKTQTTTLHWHAHAVSSIAFTSNGAYLLSGGEEAVLVIWQLHTGKKEFVPRVGAPINTVSVLQRDQGDEEYLIGLADATYLFISSGNLKISRSYSRIKLEHVSSPESASRYIRTPLAVHRTSSTLILPSSHPSSLQLFSPSSSKLLSELEVSPSNRVSRRDDKPIEPSYVEQAQVSVSGEWLATIDVRHADSGFRDEIYLKLWRWDVMSTRWILNTRIDHPHGAHDITCMSFSPASKHMLVTTGEDGTVKTWGVRSVKKKARDVEEFWVARSTFTFRSEVPTAATWSQDASLLAIVFGPYVTLYDPMTNVLCQILASPDGQAGKSAHFVGKEGRYLAVAGKHGVTLWDLVSQDVRWNYPAFSSIDEVVPHPEADSFAVFHTSQTKECRKTRILVFRAASCTPYLARSIPFKLRSIALYSGTKSLGNTFVGITDDWSVVLFGDDAKQGLSEGSTAAGITANAVAPKRTLFSDIFGKSAFAEVPDNTFSGKRQYVKSGEATGDAFDAPAYLMPALEHFFDQLVGGFLQPRPEDNPVQVAQDEDVNMDEELTDPALVGIHRARIVGQDEMDSFVSLFRNHSVKCPTTLPINGHPSMSKISGVRLSASASASAPASSKTSTKQSALPQRTPFSAPELDATELSSVTFANGRKRKKSLD